MVHLHLHSLLNNHIKDEPLTRFYQLPYNGNNFQEYIFFFNIEIGKWAWEDSNLRFPPCKGDVIATRPQAQSFLFCEKRKAGLKEKLCLFSKKKKEIDI